MFNSAKQQDVPLMSDYNDDAEALTSTSPKPILQIFRRFSAPKVAIIFPWLFCASLMTWIWELHQPQWHTKDSFPLLTYSPVQHLLEYEIRKFQLGLGSETTEYQGEPSPDLDERWNSLYSMGVSKVPIEEARKLPNKTIIFPHDEHRDYIIELDVFHQLHCLNMIRKALRPDYYHYTMPGVDGEDELLGLHHIDHCVDAIRQSLMCTVDVSVLTWEWNEERHENFEKATVLHTCRNFEKVRDWAREHMVNEPFDSKFREHNDPLDQNTWIQGYDGKR